MSDLAKNTKKDWFPLEGQAKSVGLNNKGELFFLFYQLKGFGSFFLGAFGD